jgi:hypothetical protein
MVTSKFLDRLKQYELKFKEHAKANAALQDRLYGALELVEILKGEVEAGEFEVVSIEEVDQGAVPAEVPDNVVCP